MQQMAERIAKLRKRRIYSRCDRLKLALFSVTECDTLMKKFLAVTHDTMQCAVRHETVPRLLFKRIDSVPVPHGRCMLKLRALTSAI